jgi:hypothetical protein
MQAVFGGTPGVSRFYREGDGVVVEHDASMVTAEQLMDIFRGPSAISTMTGAALLLFRVSASW